MLDLTPEERLALRIEACLAEMELANAHLAGVLNEVQKLLSEGNLFALRKEAVARYTAKICQPQVPPEQISDEERKKDLPLSLFSAKELNALTPARPSKKVQEKRKKEVA